MIAWSAANRGAHRRAGIAAGILAFAFCGSLFLAGCGDNGETVTPDVTPPAITSGPDVADLSAGGARILWTTDEASNSTVRYGADTTSTVPVSDAALVTNHSIWLLSGLSPDSTVYYRVESTDAALNTGRSDWFSFVPPTPRLVFDPDAMSPATGSSFSVDVRAEGLTNVFQVAATVTFSAAVLRCDSLTTGTFLHADADSVLFVPDIDNAAGTASFGATRYGAVEGAHGSGVLATLHFTALATGADTLRIRGTGEDLLIRDPSGLSISHLDLLELGEATVTVPPL